MSGDRGWMYRRVAERGKGITNEFRSGVQEFIAFALEHTGDVNGQILCPCIRCRNAFWVSADVVRVHLFQRGFIDSYLVWVKHGEQAEIVNIPEPVEPVQPTESGNYDVFEMLNEAYGPRNFDWDTYNQSSSNVEGDQPPNDSASDYYKILEDAGIPLYEGCENHTKLSAVTKLLHFKNDSGCSERAFNDLLSIVGEFLPKGHNLPSAYYEVKKMVKSLNLGYEKIDACENDCMLYYGADKDKVECDICDAPRYKATKPNGKGKRVPAKILRYFPLAPRLQRLYMSSHTAEHMRWHKTRDVVAGQLSHPADGDEWKKFDENFPSFAEEDRNVRLGLATDGFSPFTMSGRQYSVWPVIMVAYNLPPSMCMKDPYMFLTLLIPGPNSPRKDLNVYLRPLVDELKYLWETGVLTYDKSLKQNFMMRAALLWTITDFPALGMVSGWSTHGKLSCNVCMGDVLATQLKHGGKPVFFGSARRFLPPDHKFRDMSTQFNKHTEKTMARNRLSGAEVYTWLQSLEFPFPGFLHSKLRAPDYGKLHNWTHVSMFFELPYWTTLSIRHCIDVMHTEKNVFDNLFYTVLDVNGKTKDNNKARLDLQDLKIRKKLWIQSNNSKPKADYTLSKQQLDSLCKWLSALNLPDGYAANISRCTNGDQLKIIGLKSHDCHVFMQKLIPAAFRDLLPRNIADAIVELSTFFRDICSAQIKYSDICVMEKNIALTLCKLEMIFPPAFFDSMEHLPIHLPFELKYGGPVQYRWMYPFERYMGRLKRKVKNKARVEGSISERYTQEELVNFCSLYFEDYISTKHNRLARNEVPAPRSHSKDELAVFTQEAKPFGLSEVVYLDDDIVKNIGKYVLLNSPEISSYIKLFEDELYDERPWLDPDVVEQLIASEFKTWVEKKVKDENKYERFRDVIHGPVRLTNSYDCCIVNGYRFKVDDVNSGVLVRSSYSDEESDYYGRLEKVLKLNYPGGKSVIMFKCIWFDTADKGIKIDRNKIVQIDVKSRLKTDEVYILASQATQVYYAHNVLNPKSQWHTVITSKTRPFDDTIISQTDEVLQEAVSNPTDVQITQAEMYQNYQETEALVNYQHGNDDFVPVENEEEEVVEENEEEGENEEDLSDGDESDGY